MMDSGLALSILPQIEAIEARLEERLEEPCCAAAVSNKIIPQNSCHKKTD
jgi:hypothetical protein